MNEQTVYLLLGTNMGDKQKHLRHALEKLSLTGTIQHTSSIYETEPWGVTNQDDYLNMAVQVSTRLTPEALFKNLKAIEAAEGRNSIIQNAPRTLDIDILFYDEMVITSELLIIPHPRLHLRRFVLTPMVDIAPDLIHPVLKKSIQDLLDICPDEKTVRKYLAV
jgi:2-amino-4-hydroxy-6-hydroxymethyldihydropteridine diphosphokinase